MTSDALPDSPPDLDFFCPVCGGEVTHLWVWQEPGSERSRIFCEGCASLAAYAVLSMRECMLVDALAFNGWAGRRQLHHIFAKEHP